MSNCATNLLRGFWSFIMRSLRIIFFFGSLLFILLHLGALASTPPTPSAQNPDDILTFDEKYTIEGETGFDLRCPFEEVIEPKPTTTRPRSSTLDKIRDQIISRTKVAWHKDGMPFRRINGHPTLLDKNNRDKLITFVGVSTSDAGRYTCYLNYSQVPHNLTDRFVLHSGATFMLVVEPKNSIMPDTAPVISHPPTDQIRDAGDNVTFTCNSITTLTHQSTFWFKSCSLRNRTCINEFMRAYNSTVKDRIIGPLNKYIIKDEQGDEMKISNVTEDHIGYYGCLVKNNEGMDIRLGKLNLLHLLVESKGWETTTHLPFGHLQDRHSNNLHTLISHDGRTSPSLEQVQSDLGSWLYIGLVVFLLMIILTLCVCKSDCLKKIPLQRNKKVSQSESLIPVPIVGCKDMNIRQHLPNGDCPDIYNIGKTVDGFISGHLHQNNGHLLAQSICSQILSKENNPSISSNSDEASWGKSMSSTGDNCRAFYLHTSNTTTTTVPLYDHPPSTGAAQLCGAIVQDACVINPTYGFLRPETDSTRWAFPRRNLERLDKIGEGQFGEVWRYIARQKDGSESVVAVKQLKNRAGLGDRERLELIAEIEIMKLLDNHPNIIRLLHYCADEYEPILLIMEFAEFGKLQTYLRSCRARRKPYNCAAELGPNITSKELIKFAYHIAKGMEYVASRGIVHRDLASRNILVTRDKVCKVADFGFARRLTDDCAYERTTANPVPVKWMAPEALVENKFTTKSDVFSFGILMWEIVTLGATPYEYLTSSEVYKKVTAGGRLDRPAHCRDEIYDIMARCWFHDAAQRPSFKQVAFELEKLLLSENNYIELDQYPEHAYYNILNVAEKEVVSITS